MRERPGRALSETAYRPFIAASLLLATLVGFVLAIHVPLERLLKIGDPYRTADLIQAHGQVQLLGFAGLFVMAMSLRLMPRFAGSRVAPEPLVFLTLASFAASLVLRAVVVPWFSGGPHAALLLASVFGLVAGSTCFLFIVVGTLVGDARRFEASSLAFLIGAWLLFFACAGAAFAAIKAVADGLRVPPYLADNAVLQMELFGFLLSFILGVSLRTIPPMVGLERPGPSAAKLAIGLAVSVTVLSVCLLYLAYAPYSRVVVRSADVGFLGLGLVLIGLAWEAGVLRQRANRIRPASRPTLWLVRSAFVWMLLAGALTTYLAGSALFDGRLPSEFDFDAVRHSLGVGVVTMLISGMSMMILPEFAAERQGPNSQRYLAPSLALLLNTAAVLRVAPALAGEAWTFGQRNAAMTVAGSTAELAMLLLTLNLLRLFFRRPSSDSGAAKS